jgi:hypothetical protein
MKALASAVVIGDLDDPKEIAKTSVFSSLRMPASSARVVPNRDWL